MAKSVFLDPTSPVFLILFSLGAFILNLLYQKYVLPYLQNLADKEQQERIRRNREAKEKNSKEFLELMSAVARSEDQLEKFAREAEEERKRLLEKQKNETIVEEKEGEDETPGAMANKKKKGGSNNTPQPDGEKVKAE